MPSVKFKNDLAELDYRIMPRRLREVAEAFEAYALFHGITPVVTRVREGVCGDSGVHEAGRGIDYRDQCVLPDGSRSFLFTRDQSEQICKLLNSQYPRTDGKPIVLHHAFNGGPFHFHLQIPAAWLEHGEPQVRPVPLIPG